MAHKVKLTESELVNMIKKVISEQQVIQAAKSIGPSSSNAGQIDKKRLSNIMKNLNSLKTVPTQVIQSENPKLNGMPWSQYVATYKITPQEIEQAKKFMNAPKGTSIPQGTKPTTGVNPQQGGNPQQRVGIPQAKPKVGNPQKQTGIS